jgi:hypothetical protein
VADVTIPDNTSVVPGSSFVKTWRLRNDGTCTWGSNGYAVHALLFVGGNRLGGPASVPLPPVVRPGDTVDVSVNLLAPIAAGIYKSEWMLANDNGAPIGVGRDGATPLYAQIVVGATPTPIVDGSCSYRATFVADITIPDNTVIAPGSAFVKTWRLRNDGTCTWGSNGYALHALAFFGGDKLSGPDSVELPGEIPPGSTVDISVNLKAPANPGIYRSEWKLLNTQGPMLGVGAQGTRPLYVQIVVGTPTVPIPATRTRINFAPGNASTTFTTNLAAGAAQGYVLQVLGGQQLYVSATGNATVGVLDPSDIPMAIQRAGRPGLWIVGIPVTGDYTVVVYGDGVSTVTIYVPPL